MTDPTILFGIPIHALTMGEAVDRVLTWSRQPLAERCRYVVTPNVDHVVTYAGHPTLRAAYAGASLILADGAPVVLASRLLGKPLPERVAGSDLVPALFAQATASHVSAGNAPSEPLRVFLLGAAPGVGERARVRIEEEWGGVRVVGTLSPPIGFEHSDAENQKILAAVADVQPDVVLLGLGAPKQEVWIHRHCEQMQAKVVLCIGATIDFLAGERKRAPRWMQQMGLEWVHRLANEPGRLAKRYLRDALVFPQLVWRDWRKERASDNRDGRFAK
jgi:N-acetylglucosaminyldiphosphoundecaprenol N-acetyl-beta-D-mannosaminyltransferase